MMKELQKLFFSFLSDLAMAKFKLKTLLIIIIKSVFLSGSSSLFLVHSFASLYSQRPINTVIIDIWYYK